MKLKIEIEVGFGAFSLDEEEKEDYPDLNDPEQLKAMVEECISVDFNYVNYSYMDVVITKIEKL